MAQAFDTLRSLVRSAAGALQKGLSELEPLQAVREMVQMLKDRRVAVSDAALAATLAQALPVRGVSVRSEHPSIHVALTTTDERERTLVITPHHVRFAQQGAKELTFGVPDPAAASDPLYRSAVAALAGCVARVVFGPLLFQASVDQLLGIVETDGPTSLRVDLRTLPALRSARNSPLLALLEVIDVQHVAAQQGELFIQLRLPRL